VHSSAPSLFFFNLCCNLVDKLSVLTHSKGKPIDSLISVRGRSRLEERTVTNLHHSRTKIFYVAIDKICVDMDHHFSEGCNIVLDCFSCLDPKNFFSKFDVDNLARLADIYHADISDDDRETIREQLGTYVLQVKRHASFSSCEDVQSLAMKMVQTEKHLIFPLVYKLIELALILSVSITSVERAFSAMKIIKTKLCNKINDVWFNDLMICYVEREIFKSIDDVDIIRTFIAKRSQKGHLPPNFIQHAIGRLYFISLISNCTFVEKMTTLFYFDL